VSDFNVKPKLFDMCSKMRNIRQIAFVALVLSFFASCQSHKKEIERLNQSKDSVIQVVSEREQVIVDYIASFNEIQDKMDSIKDAQKLLKVQLSGSNVELSRGNKEQIIDDLMLINNLIEENKRTIASLQSKLKASNLKSTELQKMIDNLSRQIEEKDLEIMALNTQIEQLKIDVTQLGSQVENLKEESSQKTRTIEQQKDAMHTAYYCFGTRDELIANNVIERSGGLLGIGRTNKLKENFNQDYFMKVDTREFKEVLLMVKKAQLLTNHPADSYRFATTEKTVEYFYVENPEVFWKTTKYMVILVEPK
jgi:DNA repair exonuclease SbcCD ATPase subunit